MTLTPSTKGSFIAGVGLWCLIWAALFKADEIAAAGGLQRWVSSEQCLRWIRNHKSTSLLGTELFNYGTHGISDPLGVTFALGGHTGQRAYDLPAASDAGESKAGPYGA